MNVGAAPMPAVGAQPRTATKPIKVDPVPETPRPALNAQSEVKVYDSRVVVCSAQDTSFAVLSDRYYNSPNYAQALQRYNQEYPTAADEVKTNPPQLRTGTPIQIPPKDILELRYPELFSRSNAGQTSSRREPFSVGKPVPAPRNDPPPVAVSRPRPAQTASAKTQDPVPAPGQDASPSAGSTGSNPRYYRVAAGGEQLYEIAQRQLGSSSRWPEIYQKNPTVEPGLVPAGTVLVLPQ